MVLKLTLALLQMMIRTLYWQALRGDRNLMMEENDGLEEEMGHLNHCFDYIRQGIMCAGDMSIEGAADQGDSQGPHISGIGMKHECKSWVSQSQENGAGVRIMLISYRRRRGSGWMKTCQQGKDGCGYT